MMCNRYNQTEVIIKQIFAIVLKHHTFTRTLVRSLIHECLLTRGLKYFGETSRRAIEKSSRAADRSFAAAPITNPR